MEKYDFVTKTSTHAFHCLKWVHNNCPLVKLDVTKEEAAVIDLFGQPRLCFPIEKLGSVVVVSINSATTGYLYWNNVRVGFAIHDDVLYLRKTGCEL